MLNRSFTQDSLEVRVYDSRDAMGAGATEDAVALLKKLLSEKETVRVIFAAAPSQNEFLAGLCSATDIDWSRVTAFHMDEYIGLPSDAPQGFGNFLRERVFGRLPFGQVYYLNGNAESIEAECHRYSALLNEAPIDIVFMGIGENGHIAFNDPPVADFKDPVAIKAVRLDEICRQQQVNDGCFASIDLVPTHALSLTVPALMAAEHHLCIVPAPTKANAVAATINGAIGEACPASILRCSEGSVLYLDPDSASLL